MAVIRVEVEIAAPAKKVFDYVADVETHPLYADFVKCVKITSKQKSGKGVNFNQVHQNSLDEITSEITEYMPSKKISWVAHENDGDVLVHYFFEEAAGKTKVLHLIDSAKFDDPAKQKRTYDNNVRELENLKAILEKE